MPSLRKRAPKRRLASDPLDAAAAELAAVALLARRDYACGELAGKLRERNFDAAVVAHVLDELRARRLLNDERYAGHFVQYHVARGQGPQRIRRDLEVFGVAPQLIEDALAAVPSWVAVARAVRRRRFGPAPPAGWKETAQQARFLQYRGFSNDHIRGSLDTEIEMDT